MVDGPLGRIIWRVVDAALISVDTKKKELFGDFRNQAASIARKAMSGLARQF